MNNIDLNKYSIRTDLAIEEIELLDDFNSTLTSIDDVKVTVFDVSPDIVSKINKKEGKYITIEFQDITNFESREKIGSILEKEIKKLLEYKNISDEAECLIIGLGNNNVTPDALGPFTINNILVTRHLFLLNTNVKKGIRKVSAISPGVLGGTGIETLDLVNNLVKTINPGFVIVIDSLAASSIERVNKTIQMTDTGINPGSGIGNNRKEISFQTLGIPVISIGVPTVVDLGTVVNDITNYLFKYLSYIKNNFKKEKLIGKRVNNYIKKIKDLDLDDNEKKELFGIIGELDNNDKKQLINEVLEAINYNLIVTPKEIDYVIEKFSDVISSAINNALHKEINHY